MSSLKSYKNTDDEHFNFILSNISNKGYKTSIYNSINIILPYLLTSPYPHEIQDFLRIYKSLQCETLYDSKIEQMEGCIDNIISNSTLNTFIIALVGMLLVEKNSYKDSKLFT